MKLIVSYNNDQQLLNSEYDIFLLKTKGLNSHYYEETKQVKEVIEKAHQLNKEVYGWVNRFIFEPEMDEVKEKLQNLINLGVDGFVVNDFGLLLILRGLDFSKPVILSTDTTITNHLEIKFLVESGFDQIIAARELTLEEIKEMGEKVSNHMVVFIFGHHLISTSRRELLKAYSDLTEIPLESNKIYKLRESTREDYFLVIQDDTGTHIFDEKVFNGLDKIDELKQSGLRSFFIDDFNIETDQLLEVASILKGKQNILQGDQFTHGLWYKKTTDKKEGQ